MTVVGTTAGEERRAGARARSGRVNAIRSAWRTVRLALDMDALGEAVLQEPGEVLTLRFFDRTFHFLKRPDDIDRVLVRSGLVLGEERTARGDALGRAALGRSLFMAPPGAWARQRRHVAAAMTPRAVADRAHHIVDLQRRFVEGLRPGERHDLAETVRDFTCASFLGLLARDADLTAVPAVRAAVERHSDRFVAAFLVDPTGRSRLGALLHRRLCATRLALAGLLSELIEQDARHGTTGGPSTFARHVVESAAHARNGPPYTDREHALEEVAGLVLAGFDTTAVTLCEALLAVARDPGLQSALAEEAAAASREALSSSRLFATCPLATAVVMETLRLFPPVNMVNRWNVVETGVAGRVIRPGDMIAVWVAAVHRDPRLWARPETFDPGRFLGERPVETLKRPAFMPFGVGQRVCVGAHLALFQLVAALVLAVRTHALTFVSAGRRSRRPYHLRRLPVGARVVLRRR